MNRLGSEWRDIREMSDEVMFTDAKYYKNRNIYTLSCREMSHSACFFAFLHLSILLNILKLRT